MEENESYESQPHQKDAAEGYLEASHDSADHGRPLVSIEIAEA